MSSDHKKCRSHPMCPAYMPENQVATGLFSVHTVTRVRHACFFFWFAACIWRHRSHKSRGRSFRAEWSVRHDRSCIERARGRERERGKNREGEREQEAFCLGHFRPHYQGGVPHKGAKHPSAALAPPTIKVIQLQQPDICGEGPLSQAQTFPQT